MSTKSVPAEPTPASPSASRDPGAIASGALKAPACDVRTGPPDLETSRILRYSGAGWDEVRAEPYADGSLPLVSRRPLASPGPAGFDVRYFEIESQGATRLERHEHVHVVVCFRGRGRVRLGDETHKVGFGDVVYVAPGEVHQFQNPYAEPFGFLCVVDRERDRPVPAGG